MNFSASSPALSLSRSTSTQRSGTSATGSRSTRSVNSEQRPGTPCSTSMVNASRCPIPPSRRGRRWRCPRRARSRRWGGCPWPGAARRSGCRPGGNRRLRGGRRGSGTTACVRRAGAALRGCARRLRGRRGPGGWPCRPSGGAGPGATALGRWPAGGGRGRSGRRAAPARSTWPATCLRCLRQQGQKGCGPPTTPLAGPSELRERLFRRPGARRWRWSGRLGRCPGRTAPAAAGSG